MVIVNVCFLVSFFNEWQGQRAIGSSMQQSKAVKLPLHQPLPQMQTIFCVKNVEKWVYTLVHFFDSKVTAENWQKTLQCSFLQTRIWVFLKKTANFSSNTTCRLSFLLAKNRIKNKTKNKQKVFKILKSSLASASTAKKTLYTKNQFLPLLLLLLLLLFFTSIVALTVVFVAAKKPAQLFIDLKSI